MSNWTKLSVEELSSKQDALFKVYEGYKAQGLKLDMSRGKPCKEQLNLSNGLLDALASGDNVLLEDGTDPRNYGGIDGIPEAKRFFADMLSVSENEVIIGGNSSLTMMHDTLVRALLHGVVGSEQPWGRLAKVKFICPTPGYDRHFAICEHLGIEMVAVDMTPSGPDMDAVERMVQEDASIKGMWCVPKYSNPEGTTYSDDTVRRLASMNTKANDFRIFWDDAYTVHHLTDDPDILLNGLEACKAAGHPDRIFIFSSTSKVTFPGSGVAVMASSEDNIKLTRKQVSFQTIGPDKLNQLRHVRFLKDMDHLRNHMAKQATIIKPKFDLVLGMLEEQLGGKGIASWIAPNGGYFISLNTLDGCAKDVVRMAAEAGVVLTGAGATYPYGKDPRDRNIRIAPTFPPLEELRKAIEVLCVCIQLVSTRVLLKSENLVN